MKKSKSIFIVMFLAISFPFCCNAETSKTYGSVEVERVAGSSGDLSFTCDIKGWPSVIGSDVKVIIKGIETPSVITANEASEGFYRQQVKDFIQKALKGAKAIELKNIERAKVFALEADVVADGRNLARQLVDAGLAQVKKQKQAKKNTKPKPQSANSQGALIASKSGKVFHKSQCNFVKRISEDNLVTFGDKAHAESSGRRGCKTCKP